MQRITIIRLWYTLHGRALVSLFNVAAAFDAPSEGVNKIEICIEETSGIFQLRVVTDVFVQNSDGRPLDQLPAWMRFMF